MDGLRVFDGAVAIVTGGASGIGRALAEALAERGASVVVADRQIELTEEVAAAMRARGRQATATPLDVRDHAAVERVVADTFARHGRLDYMFNNAGIGVGGEAQDHGVDDWNLIIDVNLRGVVYGVVAAYPVMLRQGFGHIVNTASMAGLVPGTVGVSYTATKHAVVGLSKALRVEADTAGIRVSVLCPGVIRTPLLAGGKFGRMLRPVPEEKMRAGFERFRPMDPTIFAGKVLRQLARNRPIIIVPSWWRVLWWIDRASPSLSIALGRQAFVQMKKLFGI